MIKGGYELGSVLRLENVSFDYTTKAATVHAVKEASAEFHKGIFYAIVGRSGSGKSTLLSVIAGLELPCEGKIYYEDNLLSEIDRDRFRREQVGLIFQSYYLLPQLTALENVMSSLEISGYEGNKKERALSLLEKVGLSSIHGRKRVTELSGGEQQRIGIARALAPNPNIILADEPTGNLDSENSSNIVNLLKQLAHEEDKCVIVITHAQEVAKEADQVLRMKDGRIEE